MEFYSIGELCSITKGSTGIMKAVPGPYPLVTTGPERKSSNDYEFDDEAVCIPLVSSTGHGHKSLNYIHYQSGKFALGTILAAVIPKDKSVLSAEYLQRYLFFFKEQLVVTLMKGAANVSLAVRDIAKIQVPVPLINKQKEFIELFNKAENGKLSLLHENQNQSTYLTKLRQAILQEAIEGKLTESWRKENPVRQGDPDYDAEALLEKIKAEKEKLIEEGKIKKQKPLAPIKAEEVPFELPEGWVWTRLGEISLIVRGSSPRPKGDPLYWSKIKTKYHWITIADFTPFDIDGILTGTKGFLTAEGSQYSRFIEKGDLLIACSGVGSVGRSIQSGIDGYIYDGILAVRRIQHIETKAFLKLFLRYKEAQIYSYASGANWLNINTDILNNYLFALPPLQEQQAIVDRVEKLLFMVDELEKQVYERKEQSEQLMQAVLREAFEGGQ